CERRLLGAGLPLEVAVESRLAGGQLRTKAEILQRRCRIVAIEIKLQPAGGVLAMHAALNLLRTAAEAQIRNVDDVAAGLDRCRGTADRAPLPDQIVHGELCGGPERCNQLRAGAESAAVRNVESDKVKGCRMTRIGSGRPVRYAGHLRGSQMQIRAGLGPLSQHLYARVPMTGHEQLTRQEIGTDRRRARLRP